MNNNDMIQELSRPNVKPQHGYITIHKDTLKKQNDEAFRFGVIAGATYMAALAGIIIILVLDNLR